MVKILLSVQLLEPKTYYFALKPNCEKFLKWSVKPFGDVE